METGINFGQALGALPRLPVSGGTNTIAMHKAAGAWANIMWVARLMSSAASIIRMYQIEAPQLSVFMRNISKHQMALKI